MSGGQRIKPIQSLDDVLWRQSWHMVEAVIVNGGTPDADAIKALLATDLPVPLVVRLYLARKRDAGRPKLLQPQLDAVHWRRAEELIAEVTEVRRASKCSASEAARICGWSPRHYWRACETSARFRNEAAEMIGQAARYSGLTNQEFVELWSTFGGVLAL
jgi:hypothetical protein